MSSGNYPCLQRTSHSTERNAKKAVQHITLISGGCMKAFEPQWKSLGDIADVVSMLLGVCPSGRPGRTGSIKLERRVFSKVCVRVMEYDYDANRDLELGPSYRQG